MLVACPSQSVPFQVYSNTCEYLTGSCQMQSSVKADQLTLGSNATTSGFFIFLMVLLIANVNCALPLCVKLMWEIDHSYTNNEFLIFFLCRHFRAIFTLFCTLTDHGGHQNKINITLHYHNHWLLCRMSL